MKPCAMVGSLGQPVRAVSRSLLSLAISCSRRSIRAVSSSVSPLLMVVACTFCVLTGFFSAVPVTGERRLLQGQLGRRVPRPAALFLLALLQRPHDYHGG